MEVAMLVVLAACGPAHTGPAAHTGDPAPVPDLDLRLAGPDAEAMAAGPDGVLVLGRVSGADEIIDPYGAAAVVGDLDGERFVARFDLEGHLLGVSQVDLAWAGLDHQPAVGWLPGGGVRVVGWTDRSLDAPGANWADGASVLAAVDLDADGVITRAWRVAVASRAMTVGHVVFSPSGAFVVVGSFEGELRTVSTNLVAAGGGCGTGCSDGFVLDVGASGVARWAAQLGSADVDLLTSVARAPSGDVLVVGGFAGAFTFGGGTAAERQVAGLGDASESTLDAFVASFSASGDPRWVSSILAADADFVAPCGVAVATEGTIYVAGSHEGEQLVVGGETIYSLSPSDRGFWARYDADGGTLGAWPLGGREESGLTSHRCVAPDGTGGARVSMAHDGDATFVTVDGEVVLEAGAYLAQLGADGVIAARRVGDEPEDGVPGGTRDLFAVGPATWLGPVWSDGSSWMALIDRP
jgi:hypothetical protein